MTVRTLRILFVGLALVSSTSRASPEDAGLPADVTDPPARQRIVAPAQRVFRDNERATAACRLKGESWICDPALLRAFNIERQTISDTPAGVTASMTLQFSGGDAHRCVVGVHVDIRHASEPITIDWRTVSILVDGAERRSSRLAAVEPARVVSENLMFEHGTGAQCLTEDTVTDRVFAIEVPIRVGDDTEHARIEVTERVISVDERSAFALVPEPNAAPPPDEPTYPRVAGTLYGAGIGALVGGACVFGAIFGVLSTAPGYGPAAGAAAAGPLTVICGVPCGTVVGGGAGFLLANLNEWDRAQTRRTALEDQKASVVGLNAWRKKRAELGIEDEHR